MRSFYVIKPSERTFEHVEAAFASGAIDSVLMAVWSVPAITEKPWWDSYNDNVKYIKRIGQHGPVYPVVVWQNQMLPNLHRLNDPKARIDAALRLVRDTGVGGIVWDFEDYRGQATGEQQNRPPQNFGKMCRQSGLPVLGGMPQALSGGVYFNERTYSGRGGWWNCFKYHFRKLFGGPKKLPGIWVEKFRDPIPYIAEMNDCYGGFWIYSHVRFGQRINSDHRDQYVSDEPLPISWWDNLKRKTQ